LNDWSIDWLVNWLVGWLFDRLTDWLIDWLTDWKSSNRFAWLFDWWINQTMSNIILNTIDSLHKQYIHWVIHWLIDQIKKWPIENISDIWHYFVSDYTRWVPQLLFWSECINRQRCLLWSHDEKCLQTVWRRQKIKDEM